MIEEECIYIFDQLTQMLTDNGREDIVVEVKEQITILDAVPAVRLIEAEEHLWPQTSLPQPKGSKQRTHPGHSKFTQQEIEGFSKAQTSPPKDFNPITLSEFLYPPHERLKLLLRAIEAAYPMPIITGIAALDLLTQNEIRLQVSPQPEEVFILSRSELQQQEKNARNLLKLIEQLRHYID